MATFLSSTPIPTTISLLRSSTSPLLMSVNSSSSSTSSSSSRLLNLNHSGRNIKMGSTIKCELLSSSSSPKKLEIGTPIIMVEAPKTLKTAASVPCLRANSGLVKPGDVGRILSRKPKDVWAVRLTSGTYLVDGKYFKPLELDDN